MVERGSFRFTFTSLLKVRSNIADIFSLLSSRRSLSFLPILDLKVFLSDENIDSEKEGLGLIVQPVGRVLGRGRLLLDVELYLRLYLLFEVEFDWVVVDVDSVLLQLKGKIFLLLPPIDQEVQVKFGIVFESAHETDSEVGEFEQVQIIHLLLDCVGDFGLHHFILDEYLADGLLLVVDDVDLAGQTALVLVV
jgi:hypothetical protein